MAKGPPMPRGLPNRESLVTSVVISSFTPVGPPNCATTGLASTSSSSRMRPKSLGSCWMA